MYHRQCRQDEIVGLVDLVQDLTNSVATNGSEWKIGIRTRLLVLDPVKDMGVWMERLEGLWNDGEEQMAGSMFHPSCSVCPNCAMTFWSTWRETIAPANGGGHGIVLGETDAVGEEEEVL